MNKIYKKKVSLGAWAKKGEDIKDGDMIVIANEGVEDDSGDYGPKQVFMVKLSSGEEKNVSFNQTSINNLIDAFGERAINWVGKTVKAWITRQNVAGKFQLVLYVSHPEAEFKDEGFVLADNFKITQPKVDNSDIPIINENEVNIKDIPF